MCGAKLLQPMLALAGEGRVRGWQLAAHRCHARTLDVALTDAAPAVGIQLVPDLAAALERAQLVLARVITSTVM